METVLSGLIRNVCLDYLDDVVTGRTFAEHLQNLRKVFVRLHDANLRLPQLKALLTQGPILAFLILLVTSGWRQMRLG